MMVSMFIMVMYERMLVASFFSRSMMFRVSTDFVLIATVRSFSSNEIKIALLQENWSRVLFES